MATTILRRRTLLVIPTLLTALAAVAWAAAGDLDPSFGPGGVATTSLSGSTQALTVDSSGKVLTGGYYGAPKGWWVHRYNTDGSDDVGFGPGGLVSLFGSGQDALYGLAVDPRPLADTFNRPLAVGTTTVSTVAKNGSVYATAYPTIARWTTGGLLDTSFGGTGWFRVSVPGSTGGGSGSRVAVQPDGKILLLGNASFVVDKKGTSYARPFVARYNPDGSLDTGFGSGGYAIDSRFAESVTSGGFGLAVQSTTGNIVLSWRTSVRRWMITRFLSNGLIDTAFPTISSTTDYVVGVAIDASNRILATGNHPTSSGSDVMVVRYDMDGVVDPNFGSLGTTTVHVSDRNCYAWSRSLLQPLDGKIVFGVLLTTTSGRPTAAVVRLLGDGLVDPLFGSNGITTALDLGSVGTWPRGVGLAPDGGIFLGGQFNTSSLWQYVAKYAPN